MRGVSLLCGLLAVTFSASLAHALPAASFSRVLGDFTVDAGPQAVATADFNGDGKLDIAVANYDAANVSILLGNGDGTFVDSGMLYDAGVAPISIAVGDFNGDGKPDIVTADEVGDVVNVLLNLNGTTFSSAISSDTGTSPETVVVGDFNGDGKLDVATADNFDDTVTLLLGNGDGTFSIVSFCSNAPTHACSLDTDCPTNGTCEPQPIPVGSSPQGLAAADLNGDGILDMVVTNTAGGEDAIGTITVMTGIGDGTFTTQEISSPSFYCPVAVTLTDLNGDHKLDVVAVNDGSDSASILLGNGDGTFSMVCSNAPAQICTIDNDCPAGGTCAVGSSIGVGSFPEYVVAADFNGDGNTDVATTSSFDDNITVLSGLGNGTFVQPQLTEDLTDSATVVAVDDASTFPSSGTADIDDEEIAYTGKSGNTLTGVTRGANLTDAAAHDAGTTVRVVFDTGTGLEGIATADVNNDGKPDLISANSEDGTVSVLLNTTGEVSACVGDCDGNGSVTVNEIITMVNIALGNAQVAACLPGDSSGNGAIEINEIIQAVNNALDGCP